LFYKSCINFSKEINDNHYMKYGIVLKNRINDNIVEWLLENIGLRYIKWTFDSWNHRMIRFKNIDDLIIFKLKWL